jgi:hypothetical protein
MDKLCEAINSVSLLTVVANMAIPLQLCYSENDTNSVSLLTVVANKDIPLQLCYSESDTNISPRVY